MRRTTISHFSFLISHSSEAFIRNQRAIRPRDEPGTRSLSFDKLGFFPYNEENDR